MSNDRYLRGTGSQNDAYDRDAGERDYARDYGSGRGYSSARDYEAADEGRRDRGGYGGGRSFGGSREAGGRDTYTRDWGQQGYGAREYGSGGYREQGSGAGRRFDRGDYNQGGGNDWYGGSYGSDGRRFEDVGSNRHRDDDNYPRDYSSSARGERYGRQGQDRDRGGRDYGRQPQGYDYQERGFFNRAGDEVRSWFGDEDAERRREMDSRYDERYAGGNPRDHGHDDDYHSWRRGQIDALDRDYHEYRQENRSRFASEFGTWRTNRQGQRDMLTRAREQQEVVGSDGEHIGTIDHIRGDRLLLTKNDADAGGRHHSIPSSWIVSVDDKVTINKTADEAKRQWRNEENNSAMFGETKLNTAKADENDQTGARNLNKSFPGTY
ncbi:DUF2171 domain-containing protein [Sphingomonas aracearum]|uniref:DUF2171 domain-containing protein n=1 Tax=Sphingomonas aracearum TaxID=2283317 RepID=A0A369VZL1_9SPHN|nr:DUF2171 domain-containing protein [Sphingomonas aracearum]RDE06512.1 DUF2171 domain-containing protein [Sphingomonas aracearum]